MTSWEKVQGVLLLIFWSIVFAWVVIAIVTPHDRLVDFFRPIVQFVMERLGL